MRIITKQISFVQMKKGEMCEEERREERNFLFTKSSTRTTTNKKEEELEDTFSSEQKMIEKGGWLHHTKTIDKTLLFQRESSRLYKCFFDLLLSETALVHSG